MNPVARVSVSRMDDGSGDADMPSAVTGLNGVGFSSSSIEIFWDRATSEGSLVTGYDIYRNGTLIDTRDALSFFDDSLRAGVEYEYEVRAVDASGVSGASAQVSVTTHD